MEIKTLYRKLLEIEHNIQLLSEQNGLSYGLLSGTSGLALFYYTLFTVTHMEGAIKKCIALLNDSITKFENTNYYGTYCDGLAGLATVLVLLVKEGVIPYNIDDQINNCLTSSLDYYLTTGNLDFLHGAIGIATYFSFLLTIQPNNKYAVSATNLTLEALYETMLHDEDRCKWLFLEKDKKPYSNISMSHGMSAIVCYLTRIIHLKFSTLIDLHGICVSSVKYINTQMLDVSKYGSFYPYTSLEEETGIRASRLAWCYGDLGIAISQYNAGRVLDDPQMVNHALYILQYAAVKRRDIMDNMVYDACLCHGAAGIAHCFNRMYINTGIPSFKETSDYWIEKTLSMSDGKEYAGFIVKNPMGADYRSVGILEGIAGIGLSLMSSIYEKHYPWDRILNLTI